MELEYKFWFVLSCWLLPQNIVPIDYMIQNWLFYQAFKAVLNILNENVHIQEQIKMNIQTLVNRTAGSTLITIIIPSNHTIVYTSGLMEVFFKNFFI